MSHAIPALAVFLCLAAAVCAAKAAGAKDRPWPMPDWPRADPADMGFNPGQLAKARDFARTGGGSGCVVHRGRLVFSWGSQTRRYELKSTTKSIGVTAVGLALADGRFESLDDAAGKYHPGLLRTAKGRGDGWAAEITLLHLATHTAGFPKPGGAAKLLFRPGTKWLYSDSGTNWLAECVALAYRRDVRELLFKRVFTPIGIGEPDLTWRRNSYRKAKIDGIARREFGSGISANVDAMARIGLLYLREGRWQDKQLLPRDFVRSVAVTPRAVRGLPVEGEIGAEPDATNHYGLLWWTNRDGALASVPRDAYWSWGLYDSHIVVIPSLDLVVARAGSSWPRRGRNNYEALEAFLGPITAAAGDPPADRADAPAPGSFGAPYPPSRVITKVDWAPKETILRKAKGSDNWPTTWADDDALYTAYGDGWGFAPKVSRKLSMGLAKVVGGPDSFKAVNIRTRTGEDLGGGKSGRKASGLLMVNGVLYMWVRNADKAGKRSRLAWSEDHAETWTWAGWSLPLGYCTFVNYGKNYAGARDDFIYAVSHDHPSAYAPADAFVLLRAPKNKLTDRSAFEFFAGTDAAARPSWSKAFDDRKAVFRHPGKCMRSGISYNADLERYLWVQILPDGSPRFEGGFGIYEAPEPWGPWRTVYFTRTWDVGPGETAHIPPKWIQDGGRTVHMVFSGDDAFSVRRASLGIAEP